MTAREPCAGGIVLDSRRRLLLILRGKPPGQGLWSVPGGRCHPGESPAMACIREVAEETGLVVSVQSLAGRVERASPSGGVYVIDDFVCQVVAGTLQAGDDAADVRWATLNDLQRLDLTPGLYAALESWHVLPD